MFSWSHPVITAVIRWSGIRITGIVVKYLHYQWGIQNPFCCHYNLYESETENTQYPQWLFSETTIIIIILRHFTFKIVVIIFKPPHNIISSDISANQSPNFSDQHQYKIRNWWAAKKKKKQPCDGDTMLSHVNKPAFRMNWGLSTTQMVAPTQF